MFKTERNFNFTWSTKKEKKMLFIITSQVVLIKKVADNLMFSILSFVIKSHFYCLPILINKLEAPSMLICFKIKNIMFYINFNINEKKGFEVAVQVGILIFVRNIRRRRIDRALIAFESNYVYYSECVTCSTLGCCY